MAWKGCAEGAHESRGDEALQGVADHHLHGSLAIGIIPFRYVASAHRRSHGCVREE